MNHPGKLPSGTLKQEIERAPYEPLLPIEKKLIGYSLTLGVVLLVLLAWLAHG